MDKKLQNFDDWYDELKKIAGNKIFLIDKQEEYETLYKMGKTPEEIYKWELNLYIWL